MASLSSLLFPSPPPLSLSPSPLSPPHPPSVAEVMESKGIMREGSAGRRETSCLRVHTPCREGSQPGSKVSASILAFFFSLLFFFGLESASSKQILHVQRPGQALQDGYCSMCAGSHIFELSGSRNSTLRGSLWWLCGIYKLSSLSEKPKRFHLYIYPCMPSGSWASVCSREVVSCSNERKSCPALRSRSQLRRCAGDSVLHILLLPAGSVY